MREAAAPKRSRYEGRKVLKRSGCRKPVRRRRTWRKRRTRSRVEEGEGFLHAAVAWAVIAPGVEFALQRSEASRLERKGWRLPARSEVSPPWVWLHSSTLAWPEPIVMPSPAWRQATRQVHSTVRLRRLELISRAKPRLSVGSRLLPAWHFLPARVLPPTAPSTFRCRSEHVKFVHPRRSLQPSLPIGRGASCRSDD